MQFQKIYLLVPRSPNFADVSIFCKKLAFFVQKSTFTQSNIVKAVIDFIVLFSVFLRQKVTINGKVTFADFVSGIRSLDCSKLAKNPKNGNDVTIFRHDVIVKFLGGFVFLVKFSYWFRFHAIIITGSGIMTILFYKGLTRNPEIGNIPVWVLPNIWRRDRVMDTKFGTNVSNRILLNTATCQGLQLLPFLSY